MPSVAAISVIDFAAIVIDGAMPTAVRDALTARVAESSNASTGAAFRESKIVAGAIGADARAIGGAALPLIKNFARDREVLFKDARARRAEGRARAPRSASVWIARPPQSWAPAIIGPGRT